MYDLVIRNGLIVDGTRAPARRADLWIKDGRIAGIGRFDGGAAKEIDAAGRAVAPGFLDHSLPFGRLRSCALPSREQALSGGHLRALRQLRHFDPAQHLRKPGGNQRIFHQRASASNGRGRNLNPHRHRLRAAVRRRPKAGNYGLLIGHGTLRGCVMGFENRSPTPDELRRLEERLAAEMERGAFAWSLGLIYPPSAFAETWELDALAQGGQWSITASFRCTCATKPPRL